MGACTFTVRSKGATAKEAFDKKVSEALHEDGHDGYSGTIAEKRNFVMIPVPDGTTTEQGYAIADKMLDEDDPRIRDKWGPAGCIDLKDGHYIFFGWASE